jgi:hypothetical protein
MWPRRDAGRCFDDHHVEMELSYGVVWKEGSRAPVSGKLELLPRALRLDGLEGTREVPYEAVAAIRVGRSASDRINGGPSVVVERNLGDPITIATVAQPSVVGEIAAKLATLRCRCEPAVDVSFLSTPGPGDSDGGDIY